MRGSTWYDRPTAAFCLVAALVASSLVELSRGATGGGRRDSRQTYAITIRHQGVDGREMERSVAVPLEDALSSIVGVESIVSVSEYGKARVSVRFSRASADGSAAVRDAAQRVYEMLPRSAQRPEIDSADDSRVPAWTAAAFWNASGSTTGGAADTGWNDELELGRLLEKTVKPALERISGVGEVEIAGAGQAEIAVLTDEERTASVGLDAQAVARFLASSDGLFPAGTVRDGEQELVATADGRFPDETSLRRAAIPVAGGSVPLGAVAAVVRRSREPDARSRVNGVPTAVVAVIPAADTDLGALSRAVREETEALAAAGLRFQVLADRGEEEAASFRSVLSAAIQGSIAVAIAGVLLSGGAMRGFRRRKTAAICAAAVPAVLVLSAASLSAMGFRLDGILLAGLSAGLGSAVDSALLTAERLGPCIDVESGRRAMRILSPSLAAGAATSLVVLAPLAALDEVSSGTARIAAAVAVSNVIALAVAYVILPPLLLAGVSGEPSSGNQARSAERRAGKAIAATHRFARRLLALNALLCARKPYLPLALAALISVGGAVAVVIAGADVGESVESGTAYAHLEFESGSTAASVDDRLASWASFLATSEGVSSVQTNARGGSGSALISFDPKRTTRERVVSLTRRTPLAGGFVFIPEGAAGERLWRLTVAGEDDAICRRIASEAAQRLSAVEAVKETVLNFKDGPARLEFIPDRDRLAAAGLSFAAVADALRRNVHAPVAYKRIGEDGETDVRVGGRSSLIRAVDIAQLPMKGQGGSVVRVGSVMAERRRSESSRIIREDRRRVASLSVRTAAMDPRRARKMAMAALTTMELPPLYSIDFDPEAIRKAEALSGIFRLLCLAVLLCYMVIAAATESFGAPLAVLSVVPPSLGLSAALVAGFGSSVDAATAAAFVAVSGMAVNASILTVDEHRRRFPRTRSVSAGGVYRVTRARVASLAATCGTTVAGAAPFLFLDTQGNALARSLAVVTVAGVSASFITALTVVPALSVLFPRLFAGREEESIPPKGRMP